MPKLETNLIFSSVEKVNKNLEDFQVFIETGTFYGETSFAVSSLFKKVITIEIYEPLFNRAKHAFNGTNILPIFGDSLEVLPTILPNINDNAIFWLDGHNSGPGTGVGKIDFPILSECKIIDEFFHGNEAIVMVDDVRQFGKGHNYEIDDSLKTITIPQILDCFKNKTINKWWIEGSSLDPQDRLIIHISN